MTYRKLTQYARHFSEEDAGDYVHDLWLAYFLKTGRDLIKEDRPKNWYYQRLKWHHINTVRRKARYRHVHFAESDEDHEGVSEPVTLPDALERLYGADLDRALKEAIKRRYEMFYWYTPKVREKQVSLIMRIYHLLVIGLTTSEIGTRLNMSYQLVHYYRNIIRNEAQSIQSQSRKGGKDRLTGELFN